MAPTFGFRRRGRVKRCGSRSPTTAPRPAAQAITATQSTGVGLANIRDRLAQAYGAAHALTTKTNEHGGFSVIVEFPLKMENKDSS